MRTGCQRNGCWLASDQSFVSSWFVQPIKELSCAAGLCAERGCALIRQLANCATVCSEKDQHTKHLQQLEEDLETQMQKVEQRVRAEVT